LHNNLSRHTRIHHVIEENRFIFLVESHQNLLIVQIPWIQTQINYKILGSPFFFFMYHFQQKP
jgi:hypothetical protein